MTNEATGFCETCKADRLFTVDPASGGLVCEVCGRGTRAVTERAKVAAEREQLERDRAELDNAKSTPVPVVVVEKPKRRSYDELIVAGIFAGVAVVGWAVWHFAISTDSAKPHVMTPAERFAFEAQTARDSTASRPVEPEKLSIAVRQGVDDAAARAAVEHMVKVCKDRTADNNALATAWGLFTRATVEQLDADFHGEKLRVWNISLEFDHTRDKEFTLHGNTLWYWLDIDETRINPTKDDAVAMCGGSVPINTWMPL